MSYKVDFVQAVKSGILDKKKVKQNVKKYYQYLMTNNSTPTEAIADCQNRFGIGRSTVYEYIN